MAAVILSTTVWAQNGRQPASLPLPPGDAPAKRLVTLAPSLTELVYAAGAGKNLVAVAAYSDYPPDARRLPVVADANGISLEAMIALRPDLVLAWKNGTRTADIAILKMLGIKVVELQITGLEDIAQALRDIGRWTGENQSAEQAALQYERWHARLRMAHAGKPRLRVFFQISADPLMTVNGTHFISRAMALCGGDNVFADSASLTFVSSRELLFVRQPEVILLPKTPDAHAVNAAKDNADTSPDSERYAGLDAYKNGHIYSVVADHALRPGPRLFNAVEEICAVLDGVRSKRVISGPKQYM